MVSKKLIPVFLLAIISLSFFVSAYNSWGSYNPRSGMQSLVDFFVQFFEPLIRVVLGGENWVGYLLFERFLLFLILISLVYLSLSKLEPFKKNKPALWVIVISVPLIGIRFIDEVWLHTILVQYEILAIAFTSFLPLVIYFFFLHGVFEEYSAMRKIGWVFFFCIFLGLWVTIEEETFSQVYFWTAFVSLLFLFLDGTISRYFFMEKIKKAGSKDIWDAIRKLEQSRNDYIAHAYGIPENVRIKRINEIEDQIKDLHKRVH